MIVFWWTGRGYLTLVILLLTFCGFGLVEQVLPRPTLDHPWFWGWAPIVAGAINWRIGTRFNTRRGFAPPASLRDRFRYRARNRFMSLPMEIWTIPFALGGVGIMIFGLVTA